MSNFNIAMKAIAWRDTMNHSDIVKAASTLIAKQMAMQMRELWREIKASDAMTHDDFWQASKLATAMCLKVMEGITESEQP